MGKNKKYQYDDIEYDEEDDILPRSQKKERRPVRDWKKSWEQGKIVLEEDDDIELLEDDYKEHRS